MKRVAFTMYPATDAKRARAFYETVLGLRPNMTGEHGSMFWIEYDLPGGGCFALTNTTKSPVISLEVQSMEAAIAQLQANTCELLGGIVKGPHCRMQMCVDPDGNHFQLHQLDNDAPRAGN